MLVHDMIFYTKKQLPQMWPESILLRGYWRTTAVENIKKRIKGIEILLYVIIEITIYIEIILSE